MAAKKKWYEIVAPKMFEEKIVGDTPAFDPKQLIGRKIEVNLMNLVKDYSRFYTKLIFQIERVEGERAYTRFVGHDTLREHIYRMVQRRTRRIDCVQDVMTKDGKKLRIKTIFILVQRVNTATKDVARAAAHKIVEDIATKSDFEDLIKGIIRGEIQKKIRKDVSKIYPVGNVEIRKTELIEKIAVPVAERSKRRKKDHRQKQDTEKTKEKTEKTKEKNDE